MPGRNPTEAWRAFRDPLVRVAGAVSQMTRLEERDFENGVRMLSTPPEGMPFGALTLNFSFHLRHLETESGDHRMTTTRYTHSLVDSSGARAFAWHWHPESRRANVKYPHLHISKGEAFSSKHIPTGRVCIEDIILFGFDELSVTPAYETAPAVVIEVRDRHKEHRAWG